jgi:hypothetical protein
MYTAELKVSRAVRSGGHTAIILIAGTGEFFVGLMTSCLTKLLSMALPIVDTVGYAKNLLDNCYMLISEIILFVVSDWHPSSDAW